MTPTINASLAAASSPAAASKKPAGEAGQGGGFTELLSSLSGDVEDAGPGLKKLLSEAGLANGEAGELPQGVPHQLLDALAGAIEGLAEGATEDGAGMVEVGGVEIPLDVLENLADALAEGDAGDGAADVDGKAVAAAAQVLAAIAGAGADASGKAQSTPNATAELAAASDEGETAKTAGGEAGTPGQKSAANTQGQRAGAVQPAAETSTGTGEASAADANEESVVRTAGNASTTAEARASAPSTGGAEPAPANSAPGPAASQGAQAPGAPTGADGAARLLQQQQPTASQQIGRAILDQVSAGGGNARIQLDPPELGELLIRVRIDGDMVRIDIRAERPETAQMLRQGSLDLSGLLGDRGLDLLDVSVDQGGRDAWEMAREALDQRQQGDGDDESFASLLGIEDDTDADGVRQYNRLRGAYNPDGGLMYRV